MLKKFLCFCCVLMLLGCSSFSKRKYPEWYLNQPKDDSEFLYGIGESYDLDSATKMALKNISEKILVTISSESSVYKAETNVAYIEDAEYSVSEKTEEITFDSYELVKTSSAKNRIFALVKVDKQNLIRSQKKELKKVEGSISSLDKDSRRKSSLERIVALKNMKEIIKQAESKVKIIKSLQPSFDDQPYFSKYSGYGKEYTRLLNNMVFYVKTSSGFDKKAKDVFKKHLNENNIKTSDSFASGAVILDIYSDITNKNIYDSFVTKAKLYLSLMVGGRTIKTNVLEIKGSSTINRKEAQNNALKKLDKKIEEDGLFKVLRLE